ncbi:hypothetical protein LCGC14_3163390, partial [marine sediment metagenome]
MNEYSFEKLEVYNLAREYRKKIYKLTYRLPKEEKYNLINQIRRAAVSLTNKIAEGHGRYHYQENIQFLRQSRGSLEELLDDLYFIRSKFLHAGENFEILNRQES